MQNTRKTIQSNKKPNPNQDNLLLNKKIVAPEKLKILVLSGNDIVNEQLQFLHRCTNLLKLDISKNHITKIVPKVRMHQLKKLKILYLHSNRFQSMNGLEGIFYIPSLLHLTINDNPIQKVPRIQHLIVNMIPTLKILNERVIFVEERNMDVFNARNNVVIENQLIQGWRTQDDHESHYIKILELQLRYFENVWFFNNPIIKIQRFWKQKYGLLKNQRAINRKFKNKNSSLIIQTQSQQLSFLYGFFNSWQKFARQRKIVRLSLKSQVIYNDKSFLTYSHQEYLLSKRNFRLNGILEKYIDHIRERIFVRKMSERIKWQLQKKQHQFNSPYSFFQKSGISLNKRFYFSRVQSHLIQNFLAHIGKNFNWRERIDKSTSTGSVTHYLSIRVVDPEAYAVKTLYTTMTYFIWPSMRVIFLKKKKTDSTQKTGFIKIRPLIYIKNKNKYVTKQQLKKSSKVYRKLQKFYRKQYMNSLDYFQCTDDEVMKMLLRYIYYHNTKTLQFPKIVEKNQMQSLLESYDEPLLIYAQDIIKRTAAAVRIQQNWRRYIIQKNQKNSIYSKMKATRAVYRIQRFWRDQNFYHRLSFHKVLSHELKNFVGDSLMVPKQVYLNLQAICEYKNKVLLYNDLEILLDRKIQKFVGVWEHQNQIFPDYIKAKFFTNISLHQFTEVNSSPVKAYEILHFKSDVVKKQLNSGIYFEFKYRSPQECRYRIYLLALLSYRIYGSLMFLPLSKQTLHMQDYRLSVYKHLLAPKLSVDHQNVPSIPFYTGTMNNQKQKNKIKTIKKITQNGLFLFTDHHNPPKIGNNYEPEKFKVHKITLQFYQKMFRDFPKKFVQDLNYILANQHRLDAENDIKNKQKNEIFEQFAREKQRVQNLQLQNQLREQNGSFIVASSQNATLDKDRKMNDPFNISKIDKKKLSMYQIGSKTGVNFREQRNSFTQTRNFATTAQITERKININKVRLEQKNKRQQIQQKKKLNITQVQQKSKQDRQTVNNTRNLKQIERTQIMRRKVERIKSFKSRLSSTKKRDSEDDFVQQGNFVMEQQLKMIIMKDRMEKITRKATTNIVEAQGGYRKHRSFMVNSQMSEQKSDHIQNEIKNQTVPIQVSQYRDIARIDTANDDRRFEGEERKIINARTQLKKNRTQSIGAYLRDPSFVHGVFPEEYYPIENKGATFKFFPPL